ncbi:MAG: trypsin-like peptidase domain-containing protein [Geobacteraceae bacterium]|nr:trypsin-like peptidase domain-containing protein [Geobacteraceae bacterium]
MHNFPVFDDAEIAIGIKSRQNISEESLTSIRQNRALQLEAMIGESSEFLPYCFLQRGQLAGRSVGRIVVRMDRGMGPEVIGYGTGFLITPSILMTNNHVLPTPQSCLNSVVQFNHEIDLLGNEITPFEFNLAPDTFFLTNDKSKLDFTLVGIKGKNKEAPGKSFGYLSLNGSNSKIITGEPVNIIEHPQGRRKEIVVQKNEVTGFFEGGFIHYSADTLQGSSGSPVWTRWRSRLRMFSRSSPINGRLASSTWSVLPMERRGCRPARCAAAIVSALRGEASAGVAKSPFAEFILRHEGLRVTFG